MPDGGSAAALETAPTDASGTPDPTGGPRGVGTVSAPVAPGNAAGGCPSARGSRGSRCARRTQGHPARRTLTSARRTLTSALSPLHLAVGAVVAVVLVRAVTPINDLDSYWHVLLGRQILSRRTLDGIGTDWLASTPQPWRTSQWLSEVLMAVTVDSFGWWGLVALRLVLVAGILVVLAVTLLPHRPPALGVLVLGTTVFGISSFVQDRPQTLSLLFIALLAGACHRLLSGDRPPPPVAVALTCLLWAQLHPLWVLAPPAFGLVALGAVLDGARPPHPTVRGPLLATAASLAGLVNPHGVGSFLLPLRFQASTARIAEWQPTTLRSPGAVALAGLVCLSFLAWARVRDRIPRAHLLWLCAWTTFGLTAFRNVAPALLLCAPVALAAADLAWGPRIRSWSRPNGAREAAALGAALVLTVVAGAGLAVVRLARLDPLADAPGRHLAERLATLPRPVRLFNDYNASGCLAAFGGGRVRLVIDGRADLWGDTYVRRVLDAQSLGPGWQTTFSDFHPDAAVLAKAAPLTTLLVREGTWRTVAEDGDFVLLLPLRPTDAGTR